MIRALALLALAAILAGCGQKGPLKLPQAPGAPAAQPAAAQSPPSSP